MKSKSDGGGNKHRTGYLSPDTIKTAPLMQGMTRQAFDRLVEQAAKNACSETFSKIEWKMRFPE